MPRVRFEPTVPTSAQAKRVHALNSSATVTDIGNISDCNFICGSGSTSSSSIAVVAVVLVIVISFAVVVVGLQRQW
jgi:hypothetical protein